MRWRFALSFTAAVSLLPAAGQAAPPPDLTVDGYPVEAQLTAAFALPDQSLGLRYLPSYRALRDDGSAPIELHADHGTVVAQGDNAWRYLPANRFFSDLKITAEGRTLTLRVFQLTPLPANTAQLSGIPIGTYPEPAGRGAQANAYQRPRGLLLVPRSQRDTAVSTHLTLGQFVTGDQRERAVAATLLTTPLVEALEHLMTTLKERRWPGQTLTILSGWRSPRHNANVGGAPYSRHIYGDAVDLLVDADGDGRMDDLDDNGRSDRDDVEWLIARFMRQALPVTMGGAGSYDSAGPAAAFLHLDTRGVSRAWQR
ncbi:MAG: D-Ala-D-Ala carboxypeptidase family metallohydrolase [Pseudomonadota bacterium]